MPTPLPNKRLVAALTASALFFTYAWAASTHETLGDEARGRLDPGRTTTVDVTVNASGPDRLQSDAVSRLGAWPFGPARATAFDATRNILFHGAGGVVRTLDISDPSSPVVLSDAIQTRGVVQELCYDASDQTLLVAADRAGLEIWGVSDPLDPARLSITEFEYFDYPVPALDVDLADDVAYIAANVGLMQMVDVTDKANPVSLGFGGVPGCKAVEILGSFIYAFGTDFGRYEILGPGVLQHFSTETAFAVNVVDGDIRGSHAYMVKNGYVLIADLTTAFFPTVGSITHPDHYFGELVIDGSRLYVGASQGITVWDLNTPTAPPQVGLLDTHGAATLDVAGSRLYSTWGPGTNIADLTNPDIPVPIGGILAPASLSYDVDVQGTTAYVANSNGGFFTLDVTDPTTPRELGNVAVPDIALNVMVDGSLAYVAARWEGLQILDVSDPTAPIIVGQHSTPDYARGVAVAGDHAYVADLTGGLVVFDVSVPVSPVQVAQVVLPEGASRVTVRDDIAYLSCGSDGLRTVDISDPASPMLLGHLGGLDYTVGCALHGDDALLADFGDGLRVVDISNPASPVQVGSFAPAGIIAWGISVEGDLAYLSAADGTLYVVDVSTPSNPVEVGFHETAADAFETVALEGRAYVADGLAGVGVYAYGAAIATPEHAGDVSPRCIVRVSGSTATFRLPSAAVTLELFDVAGRRLLERSGARTVRFDAPAAGVYLWRATTETLHERGRIVMLR